VHRSSCKVPVIPNRLLWNLNFLKRFSKNTQILNLMKIYPVVAEQFLADRWTDRHSESNSCFSQIWEGAQKLQNYEVVYLKLGHQMISVFFVIPVNVENSSQLLKTMSDVWPLDLTQVLTHCRALFKTWICLTAIVTNVSFSRVQPLLADWVQTEHALHFY